MGTNVSKEPAASIYKVEKYDPREETVVYRKEKAGPGLWLKK
jgi:hypothetical protein